jgi:YesN/AraC family two-component response regulator
LYRVLIVDDEPMIREGLKVLVDWPKLGFRVAGAAEDGSAALAYVAGGCAVDLLVTDVKMPNMTGIELLGKLREQNSDMRVIAVSGYGEFEYVRAMAALGIENYLLKPVNEDELERTLQNVARKLDKEREQQVRAELDQYLIRENIINRWLYGSIGESELRERARFLDIDLESPPYRPALLRMPRGAAAGDSMKAFRLCRRVFRQCAACYCSRNYSGDILAVFGASGDGEAVMKLLAEADTAVRKSLPVALRAVIGRPTEHYWQISDSLREAERRAVYADLSAYVDNGAAFMPNQDKTPFSIRLAQYVLDHYAEELSLKQLAARFKCNAAYIGQVFKKDVGVTFGEYMKRLRVEKAKGLLVETSFGIGDIAVKVGYSNVSYFFSVFKKIAGQNPSEYRRSHIPDFGRRTDAR